MINIHHIKQLFLNNNINIRSINQIEIDAHIECIVVPLSWSLSDVFENNFYKIPLENLKLETQRNEKEGPFRFLAIHLTNDAIQEISQTIPAISKPGIYFLRKIARILQVPLRAIQREFGGFYGKGAVLANPYWLIHLTDCIVLNRIIPARQSRVFNRYTSFGRIEDAEEYKDL